MSKLSTFLISGLMVMLLSGGVMANVWPSPPKLWEKTDAFVVTIRDIDGTDKLTIVGEFTVNGKIYLTFRLLREGKDRKMRFDSWPSFYMYDFDGNGVIEVETGEIMNDPAHDGWNGNEVMLRRKQLT